jgi:hypothetical protein
MKAGMVEPEQTSIARQRLGINIPATTNINEEQFLFQQVVANESLPGSK